MKIQNHFRLTLIFERDGMQPRRQPVVVDDVDLCEPLCDGPVQLEVLCRDPDAPRVVLLLQRPRHHRRPRPGGGGGNLDGEVTGGPGTKDTRILQTLQKSKSLLLQSVPQ